ATLRPALEQAGHRYQTHSDTETILHAYEEHGPDCLALLRGMFAFTIWDARRQQLFCARDRLGIKPFYYYWDGRLFAFASEIKALLEHPAISAALAEDVLPDVLAFGYAGGDETLFHNIRKLLPGHRMLLDVAGPRPELKCECYWDIPEGTDGDQDLDDCGWVAETRWRLEESVQAHLMSDVPLGVFLSGGLDSSAIAALTQRSVLKRVQTFAVGYWEAQFSELGYARQVATALRTDHREVVVGRDDFFGALPKLIWHEDEPMAWPSSVPLYFVSKLAAQHVKVVLSGEGSDEIFAGYERYRWLDVNQRWAARYSLLPERARRAIREWIAVSNLLGAGLRRKLRHTVLGRELGFESLFLENFYCAFDTGVRAENYMSYWNAHPAAPPLARTLYADQKTYLVELLMKQDQMSMAASLESRVPYLDHTLVEFAARIPGRLKIRGRAQKHILKAAVRDLLPRGIVHRRKMGFPTPLAQWLRDAKAEPLYARLRSREGLLAAHLDLGEVNALIERHRSGREDATDRIWRLLNLQLWGDLFLTGRREQVWAEAAARA
ncbi:MAG TPA: asparagine synthase (glutamine-hydrolyzing), partial [Bryobacteraceae bacterium]|nr:asparagine synthase (glutamine-hydrolyzing) [Bryobacteraceae bacterium]